MSKNIRTNEADLNLVKKFLAYANCADASYALLEYIYENAKDEKEPKADDLNFGDKLTRDIEVIGIDKKPITKPKGTNTAYACAIEARFEEDSRLKGYNNKITKVKLDSKLSDRTINFTSRFKLLHHQPNTTSGFSATLFGEKRKQINKKTKEVTYTSQYGYTNYILSIRGTTPNDTGDLRADARIALGYIPQEQYEDMLLFYHQCKEKYPAITQPKSLNVVGTEIKDI
ncbi:hypothetical protein [Helicobacter sp. MIT 14-3879]|uniref:hypothetical protein n=1 Tax=Helicobacter sp. MIT 14-3879 TaxID=2040649 RepID=UPI0015F14F02|nr:hypothetical protein [Helicobacter sp. MIT 14-3879]